MNFSGNCPYRPQLYQLAFINNIKLKFNFKKNVYILKHFYISKTVKKDSSKNILNKNENATPELVAIYIQNSEC